MAISIDPATKLISVPQADLTFVSGTLYTLDSNQFRKDVMALLASEPYIWMPDAFSHNTEVTVAGTTYARTLEFINGYSIQFENTGSSYTVRIEGSNNNIFDAENGILVPTPLVTVISTNSAGLIANSLSAADVAQFFTYVLEDGETFEQAMRLLRANAAGSIAQAVDGTYQIKSKDGLKNRIEGDDAANGGRTITATDST